MRSTKLFLILLLLWTSTALAQTEEETKTEDVIQNVLEGNDVDVDFTEIYDDLNFRAKRKLNLNSAQEADLRIFPFLNQLQVQSLVQHREQFGKFISIYELQAVPHWDLSTIIAVLPYVDVSESKQYAKITLENLATMGSSELLLRSRAVLEKQKGYTKEQEMSGSQYYLGDRWNQYLRYSYRFDSRISFNFVAEKDAGEEWFRNSQKNGFDFYSFHLQVKDLGKIKNLVIGDYQMRIGQGLVMWTGLAFSKSPFVLNVKRQTVSNLTPYRSVNEALFLRGGGFTLGNEKWKNTFFVSSKNIDARINANTDTTITDFFVSSFLESGFHRTASELDIRKSLHQILVGDEINYSYKKLKLGLAGTFIKYENRAQPSDRPYQVFGFSGDKLLNVGLSYSYYFKNFSFFGETARSFPGNFATTNGAYLNLSKQITLVFLHRKFSNKYSTFWGNAFAESTSGNSENGLYSGMLFNINRAFTFSAYYDLWSFNWLRFNADALSSGYEYFGELRYKPNKKLDIYARFRNVAKMQNLSGSETPTASLIEVSKKNLRLNLSYKPTKEITLQFRAENSFYNGSNGKETGFLLFQDIKYKKLGSPLSLSARYAIFQTSSFNTAIYAYESEVLYFFSVPAYYNDGTRFYLLLNYDISKKIELWARYAITQYTNQDAIGAGLDQIIGNAKSDFKIQMRIKF